MGTRKRFVLASLFSVMLALAFLIGLMPGSEDARIGANSDDQVNMGALLDLMLSEKGADLAVDSSIDAVVVKTPEDNFQTPTIPVPVQAIGADVSESIRFVALDVNNEAVWAGSDPMSVSGQWTGDGSVASEEVFGPVFASAVDVGAFVTGTAGVSTTLGLYALANSISLSKQVETIMYDRASSPANAVEITLTEVAGGATGVDSDGNAFPDNILTDIGPGEIWTANVNTTGGLRTVLIANLDTTAKGNGGPVTVSPAPGVTVTAPGTDDYPASLVGPGETVLLVAEVVGDLEALVDDVNPGGESFSDPAGWADAVDALVPSAREGLGSYIEISLVVGSGGTFSEIDSLDGTGLSVILTVEDLTVDPDSGIELLSYPTDIASDGDGITNVPGLQTWSTVAGVASTDTSLTADLTSFSVFQPVQVPDIMLTGVDPDTIPSNEQTDLTITGVVPVGMAMNMATADMYYRITVGGIDATFRDVAGVAISENVSGSNNLYVTSPALNATKQVPVDVAIFDIVADPNNPAATLTQAVQVLDTFTLDVTEGGTGSGSTMVSPGPDAPNNEYFDGTVVNLDATADAGSTFNAWTGDTANIANPASASTTITMLADASIIAQFTAGTMYGVTYNLNGDGSINISGDAPVTTSGTTRMYTDGTMLNITAVPDAGQEFVSWSGTAAAGLADATAQNIQITVNADTDLTANFQPVTGVVDLDVTIAGDGVVDVSTGVATIVPPGRTTSVFSNTNITLTADPDPGAVFVGWSGTASAGLADATDPVAVINIAGDSDITATFSTAPLTVSGLATAGGTNEAWIFGGVVARIEGTGLNAAGTPIVSFDTGAAGGAVTAIGFRAARDGSSVDVVVPASNDTSGAATVDADVTVSIAGSTSNTLSDALTYKRYDTDASGVVTTAAILDTPDSENTVQVSVNGTNTDGAAQLTLPDLSGNLPTGVDTVYLIARAASDATVTKQTTPPLTALGTQAITDALGADTAIDDITDFSLHLYAAVEVAKNTPTVGSPTLSSASGLIDFGRPVGADGVPTEGTPATLTFDVTGTGLTTSDATDSLTTWGVASEFDYVSEITTLVKGTSANTTIGYQSEVEADEYTTDGADNLTTLTSRLYSLNGFSVRQNAILPADLAASIQLNTPTGTASGSVNGGTQVEIVSPFGDLAWLDRVTFGSNVQTSFLSTAGDSEYSVSLASPASNSAGVVDVSLYGNGDPDTPLVTLQRVFEYEAEPVTLPIGLILTLLGLLVALIGLAAGGDSGGGGGGPCFIATAAYGTPMADDIDALRAVRDDYLLTNAMGTAFVDTYYRVSPTIADAVASSPVLAAGVRVVLVPVIALSKMVIAVPMLAVLIAMSLGAIYMLRRRPRSQA